jgi:hypothetical protein
MVVKLSSCTIFDSFFYSWQLRKGNQNGAARTFFSPAYFVTALTIEKSREY